MNRLVALLFAAAALGGCASIGARYGDETSLRALDERQRQIIATQDVRGMTEIAHRNLRINAPTNQVLTREQLLAMMASGDVAAEDFVRMPESITISGSIGIVMGHESFTPTAGSASGRMFGARPLKRRYTNVYMFEGARWKFIGRHANVVGGPGR